MDDPAFFIACLISMGICGAIGFTIGKTKALEGLGVVLGLLLGPIGLIILAILPGEDNSVRDPRYDVSNRPYVSDPSSGPRIVPVPRAVVLELPPEPPERYYVCRAGGEVLGPYSRVDIDRLRLMKIVDGGTLFCREGEQEWHPIIPS